MLSELRWPKASDVSRPLRSLSAAPESPRAARGPLRAVWVSPHDKQREEQEGRPEPPPPFLRGGGGGLSGFSLH